MSTNQRDPYVWNLAVACAGVFLKQADVGFPLTSRSTQSKIVVISKYADKTGLGLTLMPPLTTDWWSWENACYPLLVELQGRTDLTSQYGTNGLLLAEYLYDLLYSRLVALGRLPA